MKQPVSFDDVFNEFLEMSLLQPASHDLYSRAARKFLKQFDMNLCQIQSRHAEGFRNKLLAAGASARTVNTYLRPLKSFGRWAAANGYVAINPFAAVSLLSEGPSPLKPYKPDEIARMIRVADDRWRAIILLGLLSMREGEILNLTIPEIQIKGAEDSYIEISPKKKTSTTWLWRAKNHACGFIGLPETIELPGISVGLHNLLRKLIVSLPAGQPYLFVKTQRYQAMMAAQRDGLLNWRCCLRPWGNFTREFRGILRRAAVEPRRFHDTRGTAATEMIKNNFPLSDTQKALRHKSPATTQDYYLYVDQKQLANKTSRIFSNCYAA